MTDIVDDCIADDVVRVGPDGDRYPGRDQYLAFIADLMPKLKGYVMKLDRVTYASEALACAELTETVELDGKPMVTPEVLVFDVTGDRRIGSIEIFIQTPAG
jgi:SnoaL-like domain